MKKLFLAVSLLLLICGICFGQSSKPEDYDPHDIYTFNATNMFDTGKEPIFADESENIFIALQENKLVPLLRCDQNFSIPISIQFEVNKDFFKCISYSIPEEYKKFERDIKYSLFEKNYITRDNIYNYNNEIYLPTFLREYKDYPVGTKIHCETYVSINGRDLISKNSFPFKFKDTITEKNGKQKKKNRTILIIQVSLPDFQISESGTIKEIEVPEKELFETPFGLMELYKTDLKLKTTIPSKIRTASTMTMTILTDYFYDEITMVKNETELKALYQTRKGYEIKNNVCAATCGYYITENDGEFYMGSIHLVCNDEAWSTIHAEVIKKSSVYYDLLIDLRLIDNKIVFVIAPEGPSSFY